MLNGKVGPFSIISLLLLSVWAPQFTSFNHSELSDSETVYLTNASISESGNPEWMTEIMGNTGAFPFYIIDFEVDQNGNYYVAGTFIPVSPGMVSM